MMFCSTVAGAAWSQARCAVNEDMAGIDPEDSSTVAAKFGIAEPMAQEIVYMNDEAFDSYWCKTPEERWLKMRQWIASHIKQPISQEREVGE